MMRWHYAVWKARMPHMWPACFSTSITELPNPEPFNQHGVVLYRGDVTCPDCLRMMGPE